jgi:hypothetical protein
MRPALVVALFTAVFLLGCSTDPRQCSTNSDCAPTEECAVTGGVLFSGGTCVSRATVPVVDLGGDAGEPMRPDADTPTDGGVISPDIGPTADAQTVDVDDIPDDDLEVVYELRDRLWEQACEAAWACPNKRTLSLALELGRFGSSDACQSAEPIRGFFDHELIVAGVQAGRLTVNEDALTPCVESFENMWCTDESLGESCRELFEPAVPTGGTCMTSFECEGENFCLLQDGCAGTCEPLLEHEDRCGMLEGVCPLGTVCNDKEPARCVEPGYSQLGGDCDEDAQCMSGTACTASRTCQELSFSPEGETCDIIDSARHCEPGLACSHLESGDGTCQQHRRQGEPCEIWLQCEAGLVCFEGTCERPREPDMSCDSDNQCAGWSVCENGFCARVDSCP